MNTDFEFVSRLHIRKVLVPIMFVLKTIFLIKRTNGSGFFKMFIFP